MELKPQSFIGEEVEVWFHHPPVYEKTPTCPDGFFWRGLRYEKVELLEEWRDFARRGRFARNMQPQHAERAAGKGSWGVGRFFFRFRVRGGEVFELYYDRAPTGVEERKGRWILFSRMAEQPD